MPVIETAAPGVEPISLSDMKAHLRVSNSTEDAYISALITAARVATEVQIGRVLISRTMRLILDELPCGRVIELPKPPAISLTSFQYLDSNDSLQTVNASSYVLDTNSTPGRIILKSGYSWPTTSPNGNAAIINYTAGYGAAAVNVPADLVHAIKFIVAQHYANREPESIGVQLQAVGKTYDWLIGPYKVY